MNDGHFFEVAPDDTTIVWEYINPMTRDGVKKIKKDNFPTYNGVFRAYRYTSDHPALLGHDLTPGESITGFDPDYITHSELTSLKDIEGNQLSGNSLRQNYPNPFSFSTTIEFAIENSKRVSLKIYDMSGSQIKTLVNETYPEGKYSLTWDGTNDGGSKVRGGMYFYILMADNQKISKKMIYSR